MKKLKILWRSVSFIMLATFLITSCQKEDETSPQVQKIENDAVISFNKLFEDGTIDEVFSQISEQFSFENISEYSEETIDFDQANETLKLLGKPEIDFERYSEEYQTLVADENSTNKDLIDLLDGSGFYTSSQLFHIENLLDAFMEAESQGQFDVANQSYLNAITRDKTLSDFDRNILILNSKLFSLYNIDDEITNLKVMGGGCMDCLKDNKRKIFGWGSAMALILAGLCIVATAGLGLVFCIIGALGLTVWSNICSWCFYPCCY